MEYFVKIIDSIAWPVAIIWLGYLFRNDLKTLLGRISTLKYKDLKADFRGTLNDVETEAKKIGSDTVTKSLKSEQGNERYYRLMRLSEISPRAAILETWLEVETELLKLCDRANFNPNHRNGYRLVQEMVANDILPENILPLIDGLRKLKNEAVHLPEFGFDEEGKRYLSVAIGISNLLETVDGKPNK